MMIEVEKRGTHIQFTGRNF